MIRRKILPVIFCTILGIVSITGYSRADEPEYKDYQLTNNKLEFFKITFKKNFIQIDIPEKSGYKTFRHEAGDIRIKDDIVQGGDQFAFNSEGLLVDNILYPYNKIYDTRITEQDDQITLIFYTRENMTSRVSASRRGNYITFAEKITITKDEFIRGLVLSIKGDIEVFGEVNKDVISLFGNVYIAEGAVVRGDVATLTRRAEVERNSSIYGEVFTGSEKRLIRHRRFYHREDEFSLSPDFKYNRVDGAALYATFKYEDYDSLLPTIWLTGGYAFESARWRYEIGLEQVLLRTRPLSLGGAYYRRLASEDDWLIGDHENIFFTLMTTEDFKDYYEAEGGRLYTHFKPFKNLTMEGGYRYEETNWIRAHRNIWSLFGGDKIFPKNFATVSEPYRQTGIDEIDSTTNAGLYARIEFDTRDSDEPFDRSAWAVTGTVEWSHPDLASDFDYRRYTASVRRYQKVNRHSILLMRGMYGGSDGYLPMYKMFFLGGLGTLEGYRHKEFPGVRFWMTNLEYRVTFPRTDLSFSLLYDVGQISGSTSFRETDEVRHSLEMAFYIESDIRLSISRRLDSADDKDPKIYARLTHLF